MAGNVLSCDENSDKIYKHDGFGTVITDSFNAPYAGPRGVCWDGNNLLSCNISGVNDFFQHSGFSNTIKDSFNCGDLSAVVLDLSWDSSNVIFCDYTKDKMFKTDGFSNTIIDSFHAPSAGAAVGPAGLTWDGTDAMSFFESAGHWCYKHSGFSNTIKDTFTSDLVDIRGLEWDGENLLCCDETRPWIGKFSGFSNTIKAVFVSPSTQPYGVGDDSWSGAAYDAILKYYTGSAWDNAKVKRWDGDSWEDFNDEVLKYWDDSAWKTVDTSG